MAVRTNIDIACAIALTGVLASALLAFGIASTLWGRRTHERLAREEGLPLLGRVPMEAVYAAIVPLGRGLARLGVSANSVSIASLLISFGAGALFGMGHFGAGAIVAVAATLADCLDGIIARETNTVSRFGQVLDTTLDRYVDAVLFTGLAVFVRSELWFLLLTLGALVGGFMVSYTSSVLRELGADDRGAPMRRPHRVAFLLTAAALTPFAEAAFPDGPIAVRLFPLVIALAAIAGIGNVSAVRRLFRTARVHSIRERAVREPQSREPQSREPQSREAPVTALAEMKAPGIDPVVTRERHP